MNSQPNQDADLQQVLSKGRSPWRRALRWLILLALIGGGVIAWRAYFSAPEITAPTFRTAEVTEGRLVVTISATGNLEPTNQVEVSSEQSGIITTVLVDDNDEIREGQVIARLDLSRLQDAVAQSKAALTVSRAQVKQAQATEKEAKATLTRLRKVAELSGGRVPSKSELTTAEAAVDRAEAEVAATRAGVIQAKANLQSAQTNLEKGDIRSPINGVVLTRSVEPGQTVAASLQAPVLFTLAEDLTQMVLQVSIDEADVAQVKPEQQASFTVDAWRDRRYAGRITQVGYGAETTDGVVSYPAKITVDNSDLSLRPGMTATATITTLTREGALLVPNAALRFRPSAPSGGPGGPGGPPEGNLLGRLLPGPPRHERKQAPAKMDDSAPKVWILRGGQPAPVPVKLGATDGQVTEILEGDLKPGDALITEQVTAPR